MWIDTHCHLDAAVFDADRDAVVAAAAAAGVSMVVIPAGHPDDFASARDVAHRYGFAYALGIHPMCVGRATLADVECRLADAARAALSDPRFVAIGEIGLDLFIDQPDLHAQKPIWEAQLRVARSLALPAIVHVRRSADLLLQGLNRCPIRGGIVHAFNGSLQQAQRFVAQGFCLGFGGASTYAGSLRIRELARVLPEDAVVVETDAPDIPPQWLRDDLHRGARADLRNSPDQLPRIAAGVAALRGVAPAELAARNAANARRVLPRLAALLDGAPR